MKQRCTAVRAREKKKTRRERRGGHTQIFGRQTGEGGAGESECAETERERQAKIKEMTEGAEEGRTGRGYMRRARATRTVNCVAV